VSAYGIISESPVDPGACVVSNAITRLCPLNALKTGVRFLDSSLMVRTYCAPHFSLSFSDDRVYVGGTSQGSCRHTFIVR
jgi:hypothetical protein